MSLFPDNHLIVPFSSQYKEIEKEMGRDPIQESKKLQAITKAREPYPWKRALRVFLLLSILLLSYYSCCLHSINLSSTTTLLDNLDHFINRKAVFLFFNAILLFLVKDSGLLSPCCAPVNKPGDEFLVRKDHQAQPKAEAHMETDADVSMATTESRKSLDLVMTEGRRDEEGIAAIEIKARAVEKTGEESGRSLELVVTGGGGDEEGKELVGVDEIKDIGIDELNRKIEEFIERVKRERRMEALQLVMV